MNKNIRTIITHAEMDNKKSLRKINDYIFRALERLNDDELMTRNGEEEIKRCNAISQASKTVIASLKTNIDIAKMKDYGSKNIVDIYSKTGLQDEEND